MTPSLAPPHAALQRAALALSNPDVRKATVYVSADMVVKATKPHKWRKNARGKSFYLTFGKPNFAERKFLADCAKAGVSLPLARPQLKFFPAGTVAA